MAEGEGPGAVSVSWAAVGTAPSQYDGAEAAPQITDEFRVFLDHIGLRAATVPPILRTLELCEVTSLDTWLGLDAEEMREVREELRAAGVSVGTRYMTCCARRSALVPPSPRPVPSLSPSAAAR